MIPDQAPWQRAANQKAALDVRAVRVALIAALTPMAFASPATAQTADGRTNRDSITVGVAAAYLPDYEGSDDYRITPAPAAIGSVSGFSFQLIGNRLSVDIIPNRPGADWDLQLGPVGAVNLNRKSRKSIDDSHVKLLPERDAAIEVGGHVGIAKVGVFTSPYDRLSVSVSYRHDVSDVHDSGIWSPSISYLTPLSRKAAAALFGSADHVSGKYGRTYFSVTPAETLQSGLPTYTAGRGWKSYTAGVAGTYSLTGDLDGGLKIVAVGTYKRMLNDYADSPVVSVAGSRDQWLGAAGLAYTF